MTTWNFPNKNPNQTDQFHLKIDASHYLLIDNSHKLLISDGGGDIWNYPDKN